MLSRTTGSLCKNMTRSSSEAKLSCCENTKVSTMSEIEQSSSPGRDRSERRDDSDQYGSDEDSSFTVFKQMFKKYKKRRPPPDLSDVIDTRLVMSSVGCHGLSVSGVSGNVPGDQLVSLGLRPLAEWRVVSMKGREGLYIIPNVITEEGQVEWLRRVFRYAEYPNRTNMTAHGTSPESDVLRNAGKRLRWTTLGVEYDWNSKEYPPEGRPVPPELAQLGAVVSRVLGLFDMKPDATIINYYPPKTALSPHVDKSERSSAPLVSVSLGQSAVYLSGGLSLSDPVVPLWLRSGDILIMHAGQRLVYHAIPSIHRTRNFVIEDDKLLEDYANESRINMTIRQVNP